MDEMFKFPIYAIFIGANLGLAAVAFLQGVLAPFAKRWIVVAMDSVLISAIVCILSSQLFWGGPEFLAYVAVSLLLLSYAILLVLSFYVPKRSGETETIRDYLGAISQGLARVFDEIQKS